MMDKIANEYRTTFSIVIAAYNCEKYILETLESINAQTFKDYEVIIIEDCSTDRTSEIVEAYIKDKAHWKMYRNEKNRGVGYSRNRAFSLAEGRFVAILDSDDIWLENKLLYQYEVLRNGLVDICYSDYSYIDMNSNDMHYTYRVKHQADYKSLMKENFIGCSTAVISSRIAKNFKMKENVLNEDFFFWLQVLKQGYVAIGITQPLVKYRIHEKGRSYNKFKAAYNRFFIYRESEQLSLPARWYYFLNYAIRASWKFMMIYWYSSRNKKRDKQGKEERNKATQAKKHSA